MNRTSKESIADARVEAGLAPQLAPSKAQFGALVRSREVCLEAFLVVTIGLFPIVDILKEAAPEHYAHANLGLGLAVMIILASLAWAGFKQSRMDASCARLMGVSVEALKAARESGGGELERMVEAYNLSRRERSEMEGALPPAPRAEGARRRAL